jgi:uncharacterized membrane protein
MVPQPDSSKTSSLMVTVRRRFLTGFITAIPLVVTWFVVSFLFRVLSDIGRPLVTGLGRLVRRVSPETAELLAQPWVVPALSALLVILVIYCLGIVASLVIGRRVIEAFDMLMRRIPIVQTIYGSVRQLLDALRQDTGEVQRVVLIEFPTPQMKAIGFVTRTLKDADTGEELAAVYVPTTPNPTSGYLEIVPIRNVISTTWTFDEAMTFIVSGGAVGKTLMNYSQSASEEAIAAARQMRDKK